jgi:hypothetical protein
MERHDNRIKIHLSTHVPIVCVCVCVCVYVCMFVLKAKCQEKSKQKRAMQGVGQGKWQFLMGYPIKASQWRTEHHQQPSVVRETTDKTFWGKMGA